MSEIQEPKVGTISVVYLLITLLLLFHCQKTCLRTKKFNVSNNENCCLIKLHKTNANLNPKERNILHPEKDNFE